MKSPEEIKRELGSVETMCWHCPYEGEPNGCNRPRGTCEKWGTAQDAIEVIEQLEEQIADTGKMGSRWISVKEREPEKRGYYLVACEGEDIPRVLYFRGKTWAVSQSHYHVPEYWVELPKPPKEG